MPRQAWGQKLAHAMADRGIDVELHYNLPWGRPDVMPHPSPVIDSMMVDFGHPMVPAHDYFGALYLSKRPDAQSIEMPRQIEDCIDTIEHAKERQKETHDEKTPGDP